MYLNPIYYRVSGCSSHFNQSIISINQFNQSINSINQSIQSINHFNQSINSINQSIQSKSTLNLKTATTSGGLQRRTKNPKSMWYLAYL